MSFATLRKTVCTDIDIGTALKEITSNPHIGDALAFDLLDGRHIECAVTDIDDKAIRFDSVDCLGDDMTYGKVEKWLDRIDHLMPDELRKAIVDTERKHTIDGKKVCRLERLFLPAASELFSGDAVLGDDGLYKQMDWYKDRRHRMKMDEHGGDSTAYWTSSQRSGNSSYFCIVNYYGNANLYSASRTWLSAPVCFRIRKS
jgi:hypothetical protein